MKPKGSAPAREMVIGYMTGPGKGRRVSLADIASWSKDRWRGWLGPSQADVSQALSKYLQQAVKQGYILRHPAEKPFKVYATYSMAE